MKYFPSILAAALVSLGLGCASTPVALAPVGPNPARQPTQAANGQLEVFSALAAHSRGTDPAWYQHTDYEIYDPAGKPIKHVGNTIGYYEESPRLVTLATGKYIVKARAKDYLRVQVPVVIESGLITRVHLDDKWAPPANAPQNELIVAPGGQPVGWRTQVSMN